MPWDLANGERLVLGRHEPVVPAAKPALFPAVTSAWISPHGEVGATTGSDGLVRVWDLQNHEPVRVLRGHTGWTGSVCLSSDLQLALSSGEYGDHTLRPWNLVAGTCVRVFDEMPQAAKKVLFTPDDRFALTTGEDGRMRVWNVGDGRCVQVFPEQRDKISDLAVSADGWRAVTIDNAGTLRVWDLDWDLSAR